MDAHQKKKIAPIVITVLSALFLPGHQPCTGSAQGGAGSNPGGVRRSDDICLHGKNQRNRWRRRR